MLSYLKKYSHYDAGHAKLLMMKSFLFLDEVIMII